MGPNQFVNSKSSKVIFPEIQRPWGRLRKCSSVAIRMPSNHLFYFIPKFWITLPNTFFFLNVYQQVACSPSEDTTRSNPHPPTCTRAHDLGTHYSWGRAMRLALAVLMDLFLYYLSLLNSRMPVHGWSKKFPDPADQRLSNLNNYKILWGFLIPLTRSAVQVFLTIILKWLSTFHFPPPLLSWFIYFPC